MEYEHENAVVEPAWQNSNLEFRANIRGTNQVCKLSEHPTRHDPRRIYNKMQSHCLYLQVAARMWFGRYGRESCDAPEELRYSYQSVLMVIGSLFLMVGYVCLPSRCRYHSSLEGCG